MYRRHPELDLFCDMLTENVRFLSEVSLRTAFERVREVWAGALSIRAALAVSRWRLQRTRQPMGFQS